MSLDELSRKIRLKTPINQASVNEDRRRTSEQAMSTRIFFLVAVCITAASLLTRTYGQAEPPREPILQIQGRGPASRITGLAFSPSGDTLYAAGWDKQIWVWQRDDQGRYQPDTNSTFRVPIGPGLDGVINAIAVSPDGQWLAVGGRSIFEGASGFHDFGKILPVSAMTNSMRADQGRIFVFNTNTRESFALRGHRGEVLSLKFVNDRSNLVLVSSAREYQPQSGSYHGVVKVWDVAQRKPLPTHILVDEPRESIGLAVRKTGPNLDSLEIAIAFRAKSNKPAFRLWDVASKRHRSMRAYAYDVVATSNGFASATDYEPGKRPARIQHWSGAGTQRSVSNLD